MKFLHLLSHYRRGIRFYSFVMAVLMTWAMFWAAAVYGRTQYLASDLNIVSGSDMENAYFLCYFPTKEDFIQGKDMEYAAYVEQALEAETGVNAVFSIQIASPASYLGNPVSVVLYEPELLEFFPRLKDWGLDFSADPDGCILTGQLSEEESDEESAAALSVGDEIVLKFSGKEAVFSLAGRLQAPYRRMTLSVSATHPQTGDLFVEGKAILMQRTDTVMGKLKTLARKFEYETSLIAVFDETVPQAQRELLLKETAAGYMCFPLSELMQNTRKQVSDTLKQELPQPIFLAISAAVAYMSIAVLTFQKKQQALAQFYLCGASRGKCAAIVFATSQQLAVLPVLLNVLVIYLWPRIDWNSFAPTRLVAINPEFMAWGMENQQLLGDLQSLHQFASTQIVLRPECLSVVLWYCILTMLISLGVTVGVMRKYTPHAFLRGVSQ